jgi:hypothetical protein
MSKAWVNAGGRPDFMNDLNTCMAVVVFIEREFPIPRRQATPGRRFHRVPHLAARNSM